MEVLRIYLRHVQPRTAWREALEIEGAAVVDLASEEPVTESEAKEKLVEHEAQRTVSGERGLCRMIAAWSEVLARERETLDWMVNAGHLTEDEASEERERCEELIRASDQGSLRYLVKYARELANTAGRVPDDRSGESEVNAVREKYERLIWESTARDAPYLIEALDLDCIESESVQDPYADLVGHERGFLVLVRPPVDAEEMRAVRRIVDANQPAHAAGSPVQLRPGIRLGRNSYLGVNSVLPVRELVLERSRLGDDSALDEREAYAQLGVKSRLDRGFVKEVLSGTDFLNRERKLMNSTAYYS